MKKFLKKIPTNILIIVLAILLLFVGYLYKVYLDPNVDYLAYAGAIVGGLFTVVGVTMTINYENDIRKEDQKRHDKERREDLAIQYKPICTIEIINFEPNKKVHINSLGFLVIPIVRISNKGRGEIYIDDIIIERKSAQDEFKKINFNTMDIGCLSSSDHFDFSISFLPNIDEINFIGNRYANNLDKFYFTLRFTVIGRNLFGDKIDPITINKKYFLENDDLIAHFDHGAKEYRNLKK